MLRFSDGRNFGRTLTGLALIVGPLVMLVSAIISPDTDNDNKLKELNSVAAHKSAYIVSAVLFLLGSLILIAASVGIIHLFRGRRVTLGQIAGSLLLLGTAVTTAFYAFTIVEYEMVNRPGLDRAQMAKYLDKANNTTSGLPLFILFILGLVLGLILLAIAARRAKLIPTWAAILIVVGGLFAFFGQSTAANIIDNVLLLIPFVILGRAVLSMSDEEWDAPREPAPRQPGPAEPAATG
jgi:drug/metabolite transporter (DMT)-like permease